MQVAFSKCWALAIVNSELYRTTMNLNMATHLLLNIAPAYYTNFGMCNVAGITIQQYISMIVGPVLVNLGNNIIFSMWGIWIIKHPNKLIFIGTDILPGGNSCDH